jgi:hypothetical protein
MLRLLFLLLVSLNAFADTSKLYIQSDKGPGGYVINDTILKFDIKTFPNGQHKTALRQISTDDNSFGIFNSSNLFIQNDPDTVLDNVKIISAILDNNFIIMKKTGHVINKQKIVVGGIGKNSYCEYMINYYSKKNSIQYKYIPYNSGPVKDMDLLAERLDVVCAANSVLLNSKQTESIYDFNKDGFRFILFLVANKNISKEKEKEIIELLKKSKTDEMSKLFKNYGYDLLLETGKEKDDIFKQQQKFWTKMKGNK